MMTVKDFSNYSDAEKIVLAEELWDSVAKNEIEISESVKNEMEARLQRIEKGHTAFYSREEVKARIHALRKNTQ